MPSEVSGDLSAGQLILEPRVWLCALLPSVLRDFLPIPLADVH